MTVGLIPHKERGLDSPSLNVRCARDLIVGFIDFKNDIIQVFGEAAGLPDSIRHERVDCFRERCVIRNLTYMKGLGEVPVAISLYISRILMILLNHIPNLKILCQRLYKLSILLHLTSL